MLDLRNAVIPDSPGKVTRIRFTPFVIATVILWSLIVGLLIGVEIYQTKQGMVYLARAEAKGLFEKYLVFLNPEFMTREFHERKREESGAHEHITSATPLDPKNIPDEWEIRALRAFATGDNEYASMETMQGGPVMRYMAPVRMEKACLACHESQGYKEGDLGGGISVSLPLQPHLDILRAHIPFTLFLYGILWAVGLGGIWFGATNLRQRLRQVWASEKALQESEACFRALFEKNYAVKLIIDPQTGAIIDANPAAGDFYGYPPERLRTMHIMDINTLPREEVLSEMTQALSEKQTCFLFQHRLADGSLRDVEVYSGPVEVHGRVLLHSIIHDVTERKKAEDDLRASEQRFRLAVYCTNDFIYERDIQTGRAQFFGDFDACLLYARGEFPRDLAGWIDHLHPDDMPRVLTTIQRHFDHEEPYVLEYRMRRKDGTYANWWDRGIILRDDAGNPSKNIGAAMDITARKRAEEALRESELFSIETQRIARVGGWKANPHTDYLKWTDGVYEIIEASRDYAPSLSEGLKVFAEESIPLIKERIIHCLATGQPFAIECPAITAGGKRLWTEVRGLRPIDEKEYSYVVGTFQDISERRHAEDALRLQALVLDQIQDRVTVTDLEGIITYVNDAEVTLLGQPKESLLGKSIAVYGEDPGKGETQQGIVDLTMRNGVWRGEVVNYAVDGREIILDCRTQVVRDSQGNPIAMCGIATDITQQKKDEQERDRLQKQLLQAQKMEAVGHLAGGIAHDFNNILQVILINAEILQSTHPKESETWIEIEEIRKSAERAADLTRQLLAFSRRQIIQPTNVDLNDVIRNILKMFRRVIGENIDLLFQPGNQLDTVSVDTGQMEQILMNLCVNARDAMPRGGRLTIETKNVSIDKAFIHEYPWAVEGGYVMLSVADTGHGMDAATCAQIFEPFFTTKEVGQGTGLGLATVYGIVKQHNGLLHVQSQPDHGTRFDIYIPRVDQPADTPLLKTETLVAGGTETLLVAEDEPSVLNLMTIILRNAGYTVLTAGNGLEAVDVFESHAAAIDLVVLDFIMPGLSGQEVMDQIRRKDQGVPFLFSSGYSDTAVHGDFVLSKNMRLIKKPYSKEVLLKAVREVLDNCRRGNLEEPLP